MPTVHKQERQTTGIRKPGMKSGASARIQAVSDVDSGGIKVSLYGRSKTGKTRLTATFKKPVLIIGGEDGTRSIRNAKGVDFVLAESSVEIMELLVDIEAGKLQYATVALDTASALQDMVLRELLGLKELPPQLSWGFASRETWGTVALKTKEILRRFTELKNMNVVITAHERNFKDEGDANELITPTVGSALSPQTTNWLNGAVEYICQTFIREKIVEKEVVGPDKKKHTMKTKTGGAEYCLRVGPHPVYMTGFRLPLGSNPLPEVIVDPTYEKILALVQGKVA